jgi:hypothetical protein
MAEDMIRTETLLVGQRETHVVMLTAVYEEGDSGAAVGQLHLLPLDRAERDIKAKQILSTNDTVRCLWISPSDELWVASADGNVGTTAAVKWPAARRTDLVYRPIGRGSKWSATSLPLLKSTGLPPSVTAVWGTSDNDVHVGVYGGHLYRWNGISWLQTFQGPGEGQKTIQAFGGTSPSDVFAVGSDNAVLHFDGSVWRPIRLPSAARENVGYTGVVVLSDATVLISGASDEGILLQGTSNGLTEFGRYPIELIGMAQTLGRVLFATGDGVAELIGRGVKMIRSTFETATISAGKGRWFFTEPDPESAGFLEYYPEDEETPWEGYDY